MRQDDRADICVRFCQGVTFQGGIDGLLREIVEVFWAVAEGPKAISDDAARQFVNLMHKLKLDNEAGSPEDK